jgi:hypothetical protein
MTQTTTKELEKGLAGDRVIGSNLGDLADWGEDLDPDKKAARAIAEAIAAGPIIDWEAKQIAREALGLTRMGQKRYDSIVQVGIGASLFVRIEEVAFKGKTYPGVGPAVALPKKSAPAPKPQARSKAPPQKMSGGGPAILSCGHTQWNHAGSEDHPDQKAARQAGFCCLAAQAADARGIRPPIHWAVRGLKHPVPENLRLTSEKMDGPGYQGLCCDPKTGLYIGGIGNDCRREGKKRCEAHSK